MRTATCPSDSFALLRTLAGGNFFRPSPPCLRLFQVDTEFFAALRTEVLALVAGHPAKQFSHTENRNHPYGQAVQLSLLNRSGRLDDTSDCHDHTLAGKGFRHAAQYPHLAQFVAAFPHAYNMRINVLPTGSGLSPHKETTLHRKPRGGYYLRARFHLPVQTNAGAEMIVGGHIYHFTERQIYFLHNGMVHAASNRGALPRCHLVWDMLLSRDACDLMFGSNGLTPHFLERVPMAERPVRPAGQYPGTAYDVVDDRVVARISDALTPVVRPDRLCSWYFRLLGLRPYRIEFADMSAET